MLHTSHSASKKANDALLYISMESLVANETYVYMISLVFNYKS